MTCCGFWIGVAEFYDACFRCIKVVDVAGVLWLCTLEAPVEISTYPIMVMDDCDSAVVCLLYQEDCVTYLKRHCLPIA